MSDMMTKLIKEKVEQAHKLCGLPPHTDTNTDAFVAFVENCEANNDVLIQRGYLAGYLRGVAEATDVTLGELLDNL